MNEGNRERELSAAIIGRGDDSPITAYCRRRYDARWRHPAAAVERILAGN